MATTLQRLGAIGRWLPRDPDGAREAIAALAAVEASAEHDGLCWELLGRVGALTGTPELARDAFAAAAAAYTRQRRGLDVAATAALAAAMPVPPFYDGREAVRRDAALLAELAGAPRDEPDLRLVSWRALLDLRRLLDAAGPSPCRISAAVARLGLDDGEAAVVIALNAAADAGADAVAVAAPPRAIAAWATLLAPSLRAPIETDLAARLIAEAILEPGGRDVPLALEPEVIAWLAGRTHRADTPGFHVIAVASEGDGDAAPSILRAVITGEAAVVVPRAQLAATAALCRRRRAELSLIEPERSLDYLEPHARDRALAVLIRELRLSGSCAALDLDDWAGAPIDPLVVARQLLGRGDPVILIDGAATQVALRRL